MWRESGRENMREEGERARQRKQEQGTGVQVKWREEYHRKNIKERELGREILKKNKSWM